MKLLLFLLPFLAASLSFGQLRYKGEVEIAASPSLVSVNEVVTDSFGVSLRGHLEVDYELDSVDFRLVLDPAVSLSGSSPDSALVQYGLTELFARYSLGNLELSAGLERLPLETARLSAPFRLEPVGNLGQPLGLLSARATLFTSDWRIRPALIYRVQDEQLGGVVSVRREFSSFDLEVHTLYLDSFSAGLGGSGLIGDIVVYGEAWLLTDPWGVRGALGLSGYWGALLWTAEAAYAADPLDTDLDLEGSLFNVSNAYPQVLGQFSLPQGDAGSWELNASLGLVDSVLQDSHTLQALGSLFYTHFESDYGLAVGPTFSHSELATVYGLRLGLTSFF